jgi:hypothetical protein
VPYVFTSLARLVTDFWTEIVEAPMTTVTIRISSVKDTKRRTLGAFHGEAQGEFIGFATAELLWKVITPKR